MSLLGAGVTTGPQLEEPGRLSAFAASLGTVLGQPGQGKTKTMENPYMEIVCEYMKYKDNSKTLGDFLEGLRKFSASPVCTDDQSSIQGYIEKIECLRAKEYADMMGSLADFSLALTREDFERNHGLFQLRVKTNIARTLEELEDELTPGNQLWMMREGKTHHRSYSHVLI